MIDDHKRRMYKLEAMLDDEMIDDEMINDEIDREIDEAVLELTLSNVDLDKHDRPVRELDISFFVRLCTELLDKIDYVMVDVCQEIPRRNEIVGGVLRLSSSAHNILMNVSVTPPRYKLKVIAGVLKEALEFDKHLAYDSSLKLDEAYALLLNMTHLVHSQLPTRRSSSSDCKEQPEPEPMQLMLSVFRKLISLKSDLKGEEDGENRDRVRELLAMLTDCNISLHSNQTMEIIVAVLRKAPVVEEQLPRQFQAKMREVHDILLDVKYAL